ncbi:lipopolysaccharide transport periplasmic protein LptA [Pseudomonadales bacterium]|jgi:lipopolysaccharide export system protein LptA|nr:lipopolysaccharide transport periplasmic protein LptA [Gammaproteobacteria bacterium]MCH9785631.1 lipopolysaccharide transport periplasmic protein LptA [Gammaproteobacteria bacterium]MDB2706370.1 lipopolysaccharide transport periplasmic protein LptA [Pseudomonadales bacterium]MDC1102694.1 lipopolysaccharide transport periplasmic protein LptA [Pseudomonadales bacterium]MDC1313450.1 lipopolysaccharide transport periplasmic protein LptA [Pseudomonadales bacterium]
MPLRLCLIVLLTLFAHQVVAQEDLLLPITIQADRATVSESLGRSEYQGNVIIAQGLLRITADQVNLTSRDKRLALIEAVSKPGDKSKARFEQAATETRPKIVATATSITYQILTETLLLTGSAQLTQGADTYQGETLSYNLAEGLFKVESDGTENNRINLIINPRPKQ